MITCLVSKSLYFTFTYHYLNLWSSVKARINQKSEPQTLWYSENLFQAWYLRSFLRTPSLSKRSNEQGFLISFKIYHLKDSLQFRYSFDRKFINWLWFSMRTLYSKNANGMQFLWFYAKIPFCYFRVLSLIQWNCVYFANHVLEF